MKRFFLTFFALLGGFCAADELYVAVNDPNAADTSEAGRGTAALPYRTIQAAVDAAPSGGTVLVRPGVYNEGSQVSPVSASDRPSRLLIEKPVTIRSTEGASVTEIRGQHAEADNHLGSGAIRCILVTADGAGSVVEGFTIANGATYSGGDNAGDARGGGIRSLAECYVVDCVFTNCFASRGGALCGGTAVRCYFRGNGGPVWNSGVAAEANLWNSVVVHDYFRKSSSGCQKSLMAVTNVNCTVVNMNGNYSDFLNCASYNLLSCAFTGNESVSGTSENCVYRKDGKGVKHCTNPFRGDFRLLSTSAAVNAGDAGYLESVIALPASISRKDFTGNDLAGKTGTIHAGASQSVADPQYSCVEAGDTTYIRVDGVQLPRKGYLYAERWPEMWSIEPSAPEFWSTSGFSTNVLSYSRTVNSSSISALRPLKDGSFRVLLPPGAKTMVLSPNNAGEVLWVDATNGSDAAGDGTSSNPYRSLQKAVDSSKAAANTGSTLVYARPGVYDAVDGTADGVAARVAYSGSKSLVIRAVGGADATAIVGSTNGVDDVRCVSGSVDVQGFTLRNGRTCGGTSDGQEGAIAKNATLIDCVVSNCAATTYACVGATGLRTRFVGNTSSGNLISAAAKHFWSYCVFARNVTGTELARGGDVESCFYNCTFRGNSTGSSTLLGTRYAVPCNCVIDANGGVLSATACEGFLGNIYWNASNTLTKDGYAKADPFFSDDADDAHVAVDSPVRGVGQLSSDLWYQKDVWQYVAADAYGNPVVLLDGGLTDAGAAQGEYLSSYALNDPAGCLAVAGGSAGHHTLASGTSVTLSVSKSPTVGRNVLGVVVADEGGVSTNLFADCPGGVWSCTISGSGVSVSIDAFSSGDWYVDAVNGDDANDGFTAATAKRTLADAVTNVAIVAGDVIHAAPGVYNAGRMQGADHSYTYSRVVLPEGVSLVSTEGRDVTFIEGEDAASEVVAAASNKDGCGEGATRCLYLNAGCRVEGFTIRKGRGFDYWDNAHARDYSGAGVYVAASATKEAVLVDCLVTDCRTGTGAGARGAVCYSCTFKDNARSGGNVIASSTLVNCLCYGSNTGNVIADDCEVYGSTLRPSGGYYAVYSASAKCYNSVILGQNNANSVYWGCVFATNSTYNAWSGSTFFNSSNCTDCRFAAIGELGLDSQLRPGAGSSLIDSGFNEYLCIDSSDANYDVAIAPRVMNGTVDVGAYEWDIRGDLKAVLGVKVKSVDFVTSNVTASGGRIALSGDAESITATIRSAGDVMLGLSVDGGTATVLLNGIAVEPTGGDYRFAVAPGDVLVVRHDGAGTAYAGRLASTRGGIIIVM